MPTVRPVVVGFVVIAIVGVICSWVGLEDEVDFGVCMYIFSMSFVLVVAVGVGSLAFARHRRWDRGCCGFGLVGAVVSAHTLT